MRSALAGSLLVRNDKCIPDGATMHVRLTCPEAHFGLCASVDHAAYNETVGMVRAVERFFSKDRRGKYYLISGAAEGWVGGLVVAIAYCRPRRPFVFLTHAFARMSMDFGACALSFDQHNLPSGGPGAFVWLSSAMVGKYIVQQGWAGVSARMLALSDVRPGAL
eukprot:15442378-Alexandrium_andersonii.AAC.1